MRRLFWKAALALMRWNARPKKGKFAFAFFVIITGISLASGVLAETPETSSGPDAADWVVLQLAKIISYIASGIGQLIVLLVGVAIIPIMQYNGFADSQVIGLGWAVVRDAVNMFFVIVLIVIAFGTIFGHQRFQWQQQVPRLLIMAIVINFSRTLSGLMIDFSQVVMFTFVNALKDIAGGNFVQMLGLQTILDVNTDAKQYAGAAGGNAGLDGPTAFDLLIAAIIATMMMLIVLVAMVFLTIILAYRIVILWVLVTIAPLAWFFKGAEGVVSMKKNPYALWWSRFSCALQLGPVLTFFLWLALSVAGSGSIAETEAFGKSTAPTGEGLSSGSLLKAMDASRMTSFIIGILLIFAGFDAAKETCDGADGVMSGMMQKAKGAGAAIAKAPVGLAALAAAKGGQLGLRGARATGRLAYQQTAGRALTYGRDKMADTLSGIGEKGTSVFHRMATRQGAKMQATRAAEADQLLKERGPMPAKVIAQRLRQGPGRGANAKKEYAALMREGLQNDGVRLLLGSDGLKEVMNKRVGDKSAQQVFEDTYAGDAKFAKEYLDAKKKMPSVFGALEHVNDADAVKALDKSEFGKKEVRDKIKGIQTGMFDRELGRNLTMEEAIQKNRLGGNVAKFWKEGEEQLQQSTSAEGLKTQPVNKIDVGVLTPENYSLEVAVKLLQGGDDTQLRALAAKTEIRNKIRADLNAVKAEGLSTTDSKKRLAFRQNLAKLGFSDDEAFDLKLTRDGDLDSVATLEDDLADFRSAVDTDQSLALRSVVNPKSERAKTAVSALSPRTLQKMLREYQNTLGREGTTPEEKRTAGEELKKVFEAAEARRDEILEIGDGKVPSGLKAEHGRLGSILKQRQHFERAEATFGLGEGELGDIAAERRTGDRAQFYVARKVINEGKDRGAIVSDLNRELADLRRQSAAQAVVLANARQTANAALETSAKAEIEKLKRQVQETQDMITTVSRMADDEFKQPLADDEFKQT